jgi:hypothetical protein
MAIVFCPRCDEPLVLDMPGQDDIDGYCSRCNQTFNIDSCRWLFDNGERVEADRGYLDRLTLWKMVNS